jgi:signal transduction histidine kinase
VFPVLAAFAQVLVMALSAVGTLASSLAPADARSPRLVASEFALLRFIAGMRAMLALLAGIGIFAYPASHSPFVYAVLLPYLVWAAILLWKTLGGWPSARWRLWLWVDALFLLATCQLLSQQAPLLGIVLVLPVVAMALLAGAAHAAALTLACALALLLLAGWLRTIGVWPPLPLFVPLVVVAFGPAAALLTRPPREAQRRALLLAAFNQRLDPRQGLGHHVDVLLQLLAADLKLSVATLSLQGLEPRVFEWRAGQGTQVVGDVVRVTLPDVGAQALALPLQNYGQPLGHLCVRRPEGAFGADDLRWLHEVMRETLPLLERSDLLEQLQRETAATERERIGRDLHDSAVQPYLGLKYGLEALARQAGRDNPIGPKIDQLVQMTNEELQTLRDVVSGLRSGDDPANKSASLEALQRQVARFQALYGLKVNIFAPEALHLRGSVAKAVLHMVNEALTNVRRHTSATAVTVLFDVQPSDVVLRLRNDFGAGESAPDDFLPRSLTERAAEFGGTVIVSHEPNFTEISITLPLLGAIG